MNTGKIEKEITKTEKALAKAKGEYRSATVALREVQAVVTAAEGRRRVADSEGGRLLDGPVLASKTLDTIAKVSISAQQYAEHDRAVENAEYELLAVRRVHSEAFQRQRHLTRRLQFLQHVALPEAQRAKRQPVEAAEPSGMQAY